MNEPQMACKVSTLEPARMYGRAITLSFFLRTALALLVHRHVPPENSPSPTAFRAVSTLTRRLVHT